FLSNTSRNAGAGEFSLHSAIEPIFARAESSAPVSLGTSRAAVVLAQLLGHEHISKPHAGVLLEMGRAVPQRSLPPCGGGTGRGVQQRCIWSVSSLGRTSSPALRGHPAPCPLPARGGGNRAARTFALKRGAGGQTFKDLCMS